MVDRRYPVLSTVRQCALLSISRASVYYRLRGTSSKNLAMAMMKLNDQKYLTTPFYGSRRINVWLGREGHSANRKRVRRLADLGTTGHLPAAPDQQAGTRAQSGSLSVGRHGDHPAHPSAEGWAADITYIPMARGFHYLVLQGKDGLVHSVRGGLAPIQHPGR